MNAPTTRTAIDGAVYIPVNLLAPSPTNPRKKFDSASLEELAGSLKRHGQIAPIVARPHPAGTPDWLAQQGRPLYEIVAGERRWRAAGLAAMTHVMVMVRDMTDFEVIEVQVIENLQREDLDPLDEANGYRALLSKGNTLQGYGSVDELAARIGKSRRYVYNRLKLIDLCPAGKAALAEGTLAVGIAQLVAALPDQDQQAKAVERMLIGYGGEPFTYRTALDFLTRNYMLRLEKARFDIKATYTTAGPCGACNKRSGAHADLFADATGGDMCQDAKCFEAKEEEAHAAEIAAATAAGYQVLTKDQARAIFPNPRGGAPIGHRVLDEPCPELTESKHKLRDLLGSKFRPILALDHPVTETVIYVAPEMQVRKALAAKDLLKGGLATDPADWAGGQARKGKDAAADEPPPSAQASHGAAPSAAPAAAAPVGKPWTPDQLQEETARRAGKLFGPTLFKALHQALVARDELPLAALLAMVRRQVLDLTLEATWLLYDVRGWDRPDADARRSIMDDVDVRLQACSGRELGELLIEAQLLAEDLSDCDVGCPADLNYTDVADLAEALQVDMDAIDDQVVAEAGTQIQAEQQERIKAAGDTKRDKMLPASPGAPRAGKAPVKYRCSASGETWSGRGLMPKWLKVKMEAGAVLTDFEVKPTSADADTSEATAAFVGTDADETEEDPA